MDLIVQAETKKLKSDGDIIKLKDEKEFLSNNNSRAMLNFGHTIGHAIENHYNYKKFNLLKVVKKFIFQ